MKAISWLFLASFLFCSATAHARSPMQHRAEGVLSSFDREKGMITLSSVSSEEPKTFVVKPSRTRFRHNGKGATRDKLPIGQLVRLYYKKESGEFVVIELSWKSPALKEPQSKK